MDAEAVSVEGQLLGNEEQQPHSDVLGPKRTRVSQPEARAECEGGNSGWVVGQGWGPDAFGCCESGRQRGRCAA